MDEFIVYIDKTPVGIISIQPEIKLHVMEDLDHVCVCYIEKEIVTNPKRFDLDYPPSMIRHVLYDPNFNEVTKQKLVFIGVDRGPYLKRLKGERCYPDPEVR